jgi:hypothetical protein
VKITLDGFNGLDILTMNCPASQQFDCGTGDWLGDAEGTLTAGSSSFTYDQTTDTYTLIWKTDKSWNDTRAC